MGIGDDEMLVRNWEELKGCKSETHYLKIDLEFGCGWIKSKTDSDDRMYLSTHTFYGSCYKGSTILLKEKGFDVEIDNWDNPKEV